MKNQDKVKHKTNKPITFLIIFVSLFVAIFSYRFYQNKSSDQTVSPYSCEVDTDCEVKNVGNCCGYYPKCVNKLHKPDPEAVKKQCAEQGHSSICGYPDVIECACDNNKCSDITE